MAIGNRFVAALLRSPAHRLLSSSLALLSVRGRRTGREFTFPVQYARADSTIVIVPGNHRRKTWWRNLREPARVRLRLRGDDLTGTARVLFADDDPHTVADALTVYGRRFPKVRTEGVVVLVDLD